MYRGGYGDVWKGTHVGETVAVKAVTMYSQDALKKKIGVGCWLCHLFMRQCADTPMQRLCREVVTWKFLHHPNVLPLMGVTMVGRRFEMVSKWMENGNVNEFLEKNPGADRLKLVGFH